MIPLNETENKIKILLNNKKSEYAAWLKQLQYKFADKGLLSMLNGTYNYATINQMNAKTQEAKQGLLNEKKEIEESKLTQCFGLLENSLKSGGHAFRITEDAIRDRNLASALAILKTYFTSPDPHSVQEIMENFNLVLPNQGAQAHINARREFLSAMMAMFPAMVLPDTVAVVMITRSTMGLSNDEIVRESIAQIMRNPTQGELNFNNLKSEIEKYMIIKNITTDQLPSSGGAKSSTSSPSMMQINQRRSAPDHSGQLTEWLENACSRHPFVRHENAKHKDSECRVKNSTAPLPSRVKPAPFMKSSSIPTSGKQKQRKIEKSSENPSSSPANVMSVSNSNQAGLFYVDADNRVFREVASDENYNLLKISAPVKSPSSAVSTENSFTNDPSKVFYVNKDGKLERISNSANIVSSNYSSPHQQFEMPNYSSKNKFLSPNFHMCDSSSSSGGRAIPKFTPKIVINSDATNNSAEEKYDNESEAELDQASISSVESESDSDDVTIISDKELIIPAFVHPQIKFFEDYEDINYTCQLLVNEPSDLLEDNIHRTESMLEINGELGVTGIWPWNEGYLYSIGLPADAFYHYDGDTPEVDLMVLNIARASLWSEGNAYGRWTQRDPKFLHRVNLHVDIAMCRVFADWPRRQVIMRYACHLTFSELDSPYTFNQLDNMTDAELIEFGLFNIPMSVIHSLVTCGRILDWIHSIQTLTEEVQRNRRLNMLSISELQPEYPHLGYRRCQPVAPSRNMCPNPGFYSYFRDLHLRKMFVLPGPPIPSIRFQRVTHQKSTLTTFPNNCVNRVSDNEITTKHDRDNEADEEDGSRQQQARRMSQFIVECNSSGGGGYNSSEDEVRYPSFSTRSESLDRLESRLVKSRLVAISPPSGRVCIDTRGHCFTVDSSLSPGGHHYTYDYDSENNYVGDSEEEESPYAEEISAYADLEIPDLVEIAGEWFDAININEDVFLPAPTATVITISDQLDVDEVVDDVPDLVEDEDSDDGEDERPSRPPGYPGGPTPRYLGQPGGPCIVNIPVPPSSGRISVPDT